MRLQPCSKAPQLCVRSSSVVDRCHQFETSLALARSADEVMKALAAALFVTALVVPASALAQKKIPKAEGHNQCPLGYVNTLGTTCVSPVYYEMVPTNGEACPSGFMNVGAGYCRKK